MFIFHQQMKSQRVSGFPLTLSLSQMRRRACEGVAGGAAFSEETEQASSVSFLPELTVSFS
jgi:hypothetical protein